MVVDSIKVIDIDYGSVMVMVMDVFIVVGVLLILI